jgi:hypothetical protein
MASLDACGAFRHIGRGVGEAARFCLLDVQSRGMASDEPFVTLPCGELTENVTFQAPDFGAAILYGDVVA